MFDNSENIVISDATAIFAALAGEPRLRLLKRLLAVAPEPVSAGILAESEGIAPSTASFHLAQLERTGLVRSRRVSRSILYSAEPARLGAMVAFLLGDCCGGRPELCAAVLRESTAPPACCAPVEATEQDPSWTS